MNLYAFVKRNNASVTAINRSYPRIYQYITQQTTIFHSIQTFHEQLIIELS